MIPTKNVGEVIIEFGSVEVNWVFRLISLFWTLCGCIYVQPLTVTLSDEKEWSSLNRSTCKLSAPPMRLFFPRSRQKRQAGSHSCRQRCLWCRNS